MPGKKTAGAPPDAQGARSIDDRTAFPVAEALVETIAGLAPDLTDEEAVWNAFVSSTGRDRREYVEAVRRTRHSIFYYQLQELYEFGIARTGRDDLPLVAGRAFSGTIYEENLSWLLQIALGEREAFQQAVIEVFRAYLSRYTGTRYLLEGEVRPGETVFTVSSREPELALAYCRRYGLDPARAFRNSFLCIAGGMQGLFERVIAGFDADACRVEALASEGLVHTPITAGDRFDFEGIAQTLVGYIRGVEARSAEEEEDERLESDLILGSELMRRTWDRVRRAGRSEELVLLRGESGTGKSFIARKIHGLSARRERPLIEVCLSSDIGSDNMVQSDLFGHEKGAFTGAGGEKKGLFQLADGGTIFLDEIGDATPELQGKLLRVIESSTFKRLGGTEDVTVDVRVIAATNRDLERMVEEGAFRRDLYYRLNVIPLVLPPLRDRREDVPALAQFLLARATKGQAAAPRLGGDVASALAGYDWPGNIRELDHSMKHAAAMAEGADIGPRDLPAPVREAVEAAGAVDTSTDAKAGAAGAAALRPGSSGIIDVAALREAVRSLDPAAVIDAGSAFEVPAHVDHAKREWLGVLIDELDGDLALIGRLWDRGSEKTLRKLVRAYGLSDRLDSARARR
ncbi:MAG: sigma 54-interacting transcriptional regulator [Planctomycetota bacterium]|jgi:DNA-binding NtrC family response regulator